MTFAERKLGAQTEQLITAVTSVNAKLDRERFAALREASLKSLRNSHAHFARTNQFQVAEQLDGLEEKFVVNGCDGLARELRHRRDSLSAVSSLSFASASSSLSSQSPTQSSTVSSKWIPEVLHLLLELSERPVEKTNLAALQLLWAARDEGEPPPPPLRWEDIAREDSWADEDDPTLWMDVDFHDSSEEDIADEDADHSDSDDTSISSSSPTQLRRILQDGTAPQQPEVPPSLEDVVISQSWRSAPPPEDSIGRPRKILISEAQLVREALFMLQGHETTLFDSKGAPILTYQLPGISWDTYKVLVTSVAEASRPLLPLRNFISHKPEIPLLQIFHDSIRQSLRVFDGQVSVIQARYVAPKTDVVVSALAVMEELRPHLRPLHALSTIVQALRAERYPHAFRCLELLFDAACLSQLEGDEATYKFLGPIFLDCFQVYLRPIRLWMEEGQLLPGDRIFFVSESKIKVPLNQVWQSLFKLRRTQDGVLHAPRFLKPAVSRIFTTGKSIVVLKHLAKYQQARDRWGKVAEPSLRFDDVCPAGSELAPFAELFSDAFDHWIKSKHHATSATLQQILFESCGLWATLDALQLVFLMADGAAGGSFASAVFAGIDKGDTRWHDRFTLTELAQESFAPSLPDTQRLLARFDTSSSDPSGSQSRASGRMSVRESLPFVKLQYRMAWPVQLIVPEESVVQYQKIFTLLLQLRRAVHVLEQHKLLDDVTATMEQSSSAAEVRTYWILRAKLLWFANALLTYLTTLVFAPGVSDMRQKLRAAEDIDAMIACHAAFVKALIEQSCLGPKLEPIRECALDVLDLAVKLEDSRRRNATREMEEMREVSRLSIATMSPTKSQRGGRQSPKKLRGRYMSPAEEEEGGDGGGGYDDAEEDMRMDIDQEGEEESYTQTLRHISADFDRHLRFIIGGLRGVARASGDTAAGKWDMLAEMLETGINDR